MSETKIVWHKYPDEVPQRYNKYLVSIQAPNGTVDVDTLFYSDFLNEWMGLGIFSQVLAWAELPEPYKPD